MAEASRHDAWQAGDRYEAYMGRWSQQVAARFLDWLALPEGRAQLLDLVRDLEPVVARTARISLASCP